MESYKRNLLSYTVLLLSVFLGAIFILIVYQANYERNILIEKNNRIIPTPTMDNRPYISNCLPWQYLNPGDIGRILCISAIAYSDQLEKDTQYNLLTKGSSTFFVMVSFKGEDDNSHKRFYIVATLDSNYGGTWDYYEAKYGNLDKQGTCLGITGKLLRRRFYQEDPDETYYIEIDPSNRIVELEGCLE